MELEEIGRRVAALARHDEVVHEMHQFFHEIMYKDENTALLMARATLPHMSNRMREATGRDLKMFVAMRQAPILPDSMLVMLIGTMLDSLILSVENTDG